MGIFKGLSGKGTFYVGSSDVKKMYVGDTKVFPPYDAGIEYLESTGTQYIDTGCFLLDGDIINVTYKQITLDLSYRNILGASSNGTDRKVFISQTSNSMFAMNTSISWMGYDKHKLSFTISTSANSVVVFDDSTRFNVYPAILEANHLLLYARNPTDAKMIGRIFSSSIVRYGRIIQDLIPVRIGQTGYLYDKVSRQLFGNSGTGNFILGPDIV